jgi:hypothetical protein
MMVHGWSVSLFQASQQRARIGKTVSGRFKEFEKHLSDLAVSHQAFAQQTDGSRPASPHENPDIGFHGAKLAI